MGDQKKIEAALKEARAGSSLIALMELERLVRTSTHPQILAWLGYCLAKEKRN